MIAIYSCESFFFFRSNIKEFPTLPINFCSTLGEIEQNCEKNRSFHGSPHDISKVLPYVYQHFRFLYLIFLPATKMYVQKIARQIRVCYSAMFLCHRKSIFITDCKLF